MIFRRKKNIDTSIFQTKFLKIFENEHFQKNLKMNIFKINVCFKKYANFLPKFSFAMSQEWL